MPFMELELIEELFSPAQAKEILRQLTESMALFRTEGPPEQRAGGDMSLVTKRE